MTVDFRISEATPKDFASPDYFGVVDLRLVDRRAQWRLGGLAGHIFLLRGSGQSDTSIVQFDSAHFRD